MNDWKTVDLEEKLHWLSWNVLKLEYAQASWDELPDPIKSHWLVSRRKQRRLNT